ncbi:MAG: DEAD/DEAH box helicase [Brevinema sp.]
MNSLFELVLHLHTNNQRINSLTVSLNIDPLFLELIDSQKSFGILYSRYPEIRPIELAFLNYWTSLKKDSKKNNAVIFHAPFDQELISFITQIPCVLTGEKQKSLSYVAKAFSPKIFLDIANSTISLDPNEESLLLPSTIPYIIKNHTIAPLYILFRSTTTDDLFLHGRSSITITESSFLIEEIQNKQSLLSKYLTAPKIIHPESITPIFEFHYNKSNHKYELALFLEALINNKKHLFPLHLESARKYLHSHNDFAIKGEHNNALLINHQHPIRKQLETIIEKSFQNFYSLLGEIKDNKIITDDRVNFFENFLPQIAENTKIYHIGKKQKLQFILGTETPAISISKSSQTPLFSSIDWLSINFEYNYQELKLSLADLEQIINQGFLEIDDSLIAIPENQLEKIKQLLALRQQKHHTEVQIQASFLPWILSLYPDALIPEEWEELKDFIHQGTVPQIKVPNTSILRNYQKIGVERMALLYKFGFGFILADEMGLGKTLQILTLLDLYSSHGKTLIITPTALMLNWLVEVQKFYPDRFDILLVSGSKQQREEKLKTLDQHRIIITSYHMLNFDIEHYQHQQFHFCILDEAQHIKNINSKRTKNVKKIQALSKIAVSGTPLENNISELWSIFDFVMPGFLGSHKYFQKHFEDPLQGFDIQKRKDTLDRLYQFCHPFIIRRTKDTVYKELPPKIEQTILTELTDRQKSLYVDTLSKVKDHFQTIITENRLNHNRIDFLSALTKLRQITLHPGLIYPELAQENPELYSSKMTALLELLDEALESNHRVLIFSQFISMLKIIQQVLKKRHIDFLYIDGKTNNRIQLTEEFNNSTIPIFLISLRAGGIGLNLTGADTVILFDPWWNPAVENQAIDRAHRIGQHKTVNIYRLMTKGTIEEKIYNLQRKKDFLFDNLMQENNNFGTFSSEDLLSLINDQDL